MNPRQNATLKILLLYLLSTALLLAIALPIIYSFQTQALFDSEKELLFDARGALFFTLHSRAKKSDEALKESLDNISQTFNLSFALFANKQLLFSNLAYLDLAQIHTLESNRGKITLIDGRAYLFDTWRKKLKNSSYLNDLQVIIEGNDLKEALFGLKIWYFFFSFLAIVGVGIVAFFIVRLALRPLQNQIQMLNDFLKDSTHEINTPLSIIMMSIERFNQDELSAKNKKLLHNILIASRTISHLYDDLIYLNFPNAIPNNLIEFDMQQLINERLEYFAPHITKKQLQLTTKLQPLPFNANPHKIAMLIDNLLSNAIKYNHHNGILDLQLDNHIFSIRNSGSISASEKTRIFERYTRANNDQGGFGIGLALAKQICAEYQINISVASDETTTTFCLQFPT